MSTYDADMGSRSKNPRTLTGVPYEALSHGKKNGHFTVKKVFESGTALLFAGGDLEIVFYDSLPVIFRRRGHTYFNKELRDSYGKPLADEVIHYGARRGRGLPASEFGLRLIDNMIIALKRTMAPHDIVAESSELTGIISKTLQELFDIANTDTEDAETVKEKVLDARMRLFTRLMGLDSRRKPAEETEEDE
jgi:hypothetical protein